MSAAYITLDHVVSSLLLRKELPDHWYIQYLKLAVDCYRELSFDTLLISHEEVVECVDGVIKMPCGFVDVVAVWHYDDPNKRTFAVTDINWRKQTLTIGWNEKFAKSGKYVLEFTTNGLECNAATKIHPYAQRTIETYIEWKTSPNRNNPRSAEAVEHGDEHNKLRGRLNDLTPEIIEMLAERRTHIDSTENMQWVYDYLLP